MKQKKGFLDLAKKTMLILSTSLLAINQSQGQNDNVENINIEPSTEVKFQEKLVLKVNPNQSTNNLLAFHRSHSSHSSHSSHRSHSSHYSSSYSSSSSRSGGGGSVLPYILGGGALLYGFSQLMSDKDKKK